jgi:hypothetical protein
MHRASPHPPHPPPSARGAPPPKPGAAGEADEAASRLATALATNTVDAWEKDRLRYGRAAAAWGQRLGSYIETPRENDPEHRREAVRNREPEVLMVETAAHEPHRYLELEKF